ncbi:MAG: helix-hairpin-helix domain-containing protein [Bacteroidia bacterium]|nr:helix-hairpin-helix domain-containing protein [Bacteroidia bacterium]MCF8427659.1 helix-hairpin-helix domain-containing protein [Bacteroidia bacterium]MCF8446915.1 helix-hairpin-helix domain-containing protein [Bacteroidia bacterium]
MALLFNPFFEPKKQLVEATVLNDFLVSNAIQNSNDFSKDFQFKKATFAKQDFEKNNTFKSYSKDSSYSSKKVFVKLPLEMNSCDSASLVYLPKIGPALASRIINYRNRLGGFYNLEQLCEIYGFKEDFLYDLEGKIWIDKTLVKPILLNTISLTELKTHPYFKYTLSQAVINYRKQHGVFVEMEDLKKIKLVNDSIYNLISPYCFINK